MRALTTRKILTLATIILLGCFKSYCQVGNVSIEQDPKVALLLKERQQLLKEGVLKSYFSIQVISGEIKTARETLTDCKTKFTDYTSDIVYQTPHYKVWVGKFRNRLDADAALLKVTEDYPGAFVFKPESKK